jgi:hypothetical protein
MIGGYLRVQHVRNGEVLYDNIHHNGVTLDGLEGFVKETFSAEEFDNSKDFHIGMVDIQSFLSFAHTDTLPTNGWEEFTNYRAYQQNLTTLADSNLRAIVDNNASASSPTAIVSLTSRFGFFAPHGGTIVGFFLTKAESKNNTGDRLWATVSLGTSLTLSPGDDLFVNYVVDLDRVSIL